MIQDLGRKTKTRCPLCRPGQKLRHAKLYRKEIDWALKHTKGYATAQEMFTDIFKKR